MKMGNLHKHIGFELRLNIRSHLSISTPYFDPTETYEEMDIILHELTFTIMSISILCGPKGLKQ